MEATEAPPLVKGATLKQARLAAILADTKNPPKSRKDAMLRAGYAPSTADRNTGRQLGTAGVERAAVAIRDAQRDRARGLAAIEQIAFEDPTEIRALETRDKYQVGLAAAKLRNDMGVEPEAGSAAAFKAERSKDRRRAMRLLLAVIRGMNPQQVVLSHLDSAHNLATDDAEQGVTIDAEEVAASCTQVTQYPLSDVTPQSPHDPVLEGEIVEPDSDGGR